MQITWVERSPVAWTAMGERANGARYLLRVEQATAYPVRPPRFKVYVDWVFAGEAPSLAAAKEMAEAALRRRMERDAALKAEG